jgi:hypothetical protein
MSIEIGLKANSQDLRERVVRAADRGEQRQGQIEKWVY